MVAFTTEVEVADGHAVKEAKRIANEKWMAYSKVGRERFKDISESEKRPCFVAEFFGDYPPISSIIQIVRLVRSGIADIVNTPTSSEYHT